MVEHRVKTRLAGLDALRGAAALTVMLFHLTLRPKPMLPLGFTGVEVFFCLSGFVLAYAYEAELDAGMSAGAYALQRWIRLYPLYLAGLVVGLAAYGLGPASNPPFAAAVAAARSLLLIPTLTPFSIGDGPYLETDPLFPFDNPAWSLLLEAICSGLFFVWRPRGTALAATVTALGAVLISCTLHIHTAGGERQSTFLAGFPRALFCFYGGLAVYRLWRAGVLERAPRSALVASAALAIGACCKLSFASYFLIVFLAAPLLTAMATAEPKAPALRRAFQWLGDLSYPLYLLHMPAFALIRDATTAMGLPADLWTNGTPLVLAPLMIAIATAAAAGDATVRRWLRARLAPFGRAPRPAPAE